LTSKVANNRDFASLTLVRAAFIGPLIVAGRKLVNSGMYWVKKQPLKPILAQRLLLGGKADAQVPGIEWLVSVKKRTM